MPQINPIKPTILVIFGATGDLAQKKLLPALLDLYEGDHLSEQFRIVAFTRRQWDVEAYREFAYEQAFQKNHHDHSRRAIKHFLQLIDHFQGTFDNEQSFHDLGERLGGIEKEFGTCANILYYLAVPPEYYSHILEQLSAAGIARGCSDEKGWSRILIEKPFGRDDQSAQKLDQTLSTLFEEEQIFRIDHYLAKETIQDILLFRFSNALFRPLWNNEHIESITFIMHEEKGLEGRVSFYEGIGALRDVGQNHLLQMLALITMKDPGELSTSAVREKRAEVLQELRLHAAAPPPLRAQYEGYTKEKGVAEQSTTETFFRLTAEVDNDTWRGVPLILESGKALDQSQVKIIIKFKPTTSTVCDLDRRDDCEYQNTLTFNIQPVEGIEVCFWAKKPGFTKELIEKKLSFQYRDTNDWKTFPDAYQHVLLNAFLGDQLLFASDEEQQAQWDFITPILHSWDKRQLLLYAPGSAPDTINE